MLSKAVGPMTRTAWGWGFLAVRVLQRQGRIQQKSCPYALARGKHKWGRAGQRG